MIINKLKCLKCNNLSTKSTGAFDNNDGTIDYTINYQCAFCKLEVAHINSLDKYKKELIFYRYSYHDMMLVGHANFNKGIKGFQSGPWTFIKKYDDTSVGSFPNEIRKFLIPEEISIDGFNDVIKKINKLKNFK